MKKLIYMLMVLFFVGFLMSSVNAQEDVGRLLQELENSSDRFSKSFDNALDNSEINGTSTEGDATRYVKDFEDSIDHLKKEYDGGKETKVAAAEVLQRARLINSMMRRYKFNATTQTDWRTVKIDLNRLAKAYRLKKL